MRWFCGSIVFAPVFVALLAAQARAQEWWFEQPRAASAAWVSPDDGWFSSATGAIRQDPLRLDVAMLFHRLDHAGFRVGVTFWEVFDRRFALRANFARVFPFAGQEAAVGEGTQDLGLTVTLPPIQLIGRLGKQTNDTWWSLVRGWYRLIPGELAAGLSVRAEHGRAFNRLAVAAGAHWQYTVALTESWRVRGWLDVWLREGNSEVSGGIAFEFLGTASEPASPPPYDTAGP